MSRADGFFSDDVAMVADLARRFFQSEFLPHAERWRRQGRIDRSLWEKAGELGLLAASLPSEYGGAGSHDHMAAVLLEQGRAGDASWGLSIHNYVCHYVLAYGSEEQKVRWLPRLASGELIAAIAMTEPGAGSDLKAITTTAVASKNGYLINGQKTFISNGQTADLICVVAKTDPAAGAKGISLLMVETAHAPGFRRGKPLDKIGLHAADTSELFFDAVPVDAGALLGTVPGKGFAQLMTQLPWERLAIALRAVGQCEFALAETLAYARERKLFGGKLLDQQNTQFVLAEVATMVEAMRSLVMSCLASLREDQLGVERAAMAKLFCAQTANKVADACLQLFGGYGYMNEYPIGRFFCDARALKLYGGTDEVMKTIIARSLIAGKS
jgi:alkylation response protein AidB-like acyl-CoA dehydrogenase